MKRIILATAGVAVLAVFAATLGSAQPTATSGPARRRRRRRSLPKLPAGNRLSGSGSSSASSAIRRRSAIWTSAARTPASTSRSPSGSPATHSAVNSASRSSAHRLPCREPLMTSGRVDLVISTFTYTADRDTRIDFSRAYYKATGRLLVKNDSTIQSLNDIRGRKVATTRGLDLRPLDEALFPDQPRCSLSRASPTLSSPSIRAGPTRVMFDDTSLALHRSDRPEREVDGRSLPGGAVRHRDQAGQRRAEALGRRAAQPDEEEGHLPADHQEQRGTAVRDRVLEEHPAAEQYFYVSGSDAAQRRHRLPVELARSLTKRSGRVRRPLPSSPWCSPPTTSGRSSRRTGGSCSTVSSTRSRCLRSLSLGAFVIGRGARRSARTPHSGPQPARLRSTSS